MPTNIKLLSLKPILESVNASKNKSAAEINKFTAKKILDWEDKMSVSNSWG